MSEIIAQVETNTHIFKENLKLITSFIIDAVWKDCISKERLQDSIQSALKDFFRGSIEEIGETEEENVSISFDHSQLKKIDSSEKIRSLSQSSVASNQDADFFFQYLNREASSTSQLQSTPKVYRTPSLISQKSKANCNFASNEASINQKSAYKNENAEAINTTFCDKKAEEKPRADFSIRYHKNKERVKPDFKHAQSPQSNKSSRQVMQSPSQAYMRDKNKENYRGSPSSCRMISYSNLQPNLPRPLINYSFKK